MQTLGAIKARAFKQEEEFTVDVPQDVVDRNSMATRQMCASRPRWCPSRPLEGLRVRGTGELLDASSLTSYNPVQA